MKLLRYALLLAAGVVAVGYPYHLEKTTYHFYTNKIRKQRKGILLSDLHGQAYASPNPIVKYVQEEKPDFIVFPGDLFDSFSDDQQGWDLIDQLKEYPIFYTTGNHEEVREDKEELIQRLKEKGVVVLNHESVLLTLGEDSIEIGGIECRKYEVDYTPEEVNEMWHTNQYRILLSHRPHWIHLYKRTLCDLVISGHAHGGQVCFPGTKKGLGAPQQGLFPEYTNGVHSLGDCQLLIGRGLVKNYHGIPRLFNNPEVVVFYIHPESKFNG